MDLRISSVSDLTNRTAFPKLTESQQSEDSNSIVLFDLNSNQKDIQDLRHELADLNQDYERHRRETKVRYALESEVSLSRSVQDDLLKRILKYGWGRLPHIVTRLLKSPTRYGLKLVDVALLITIYDRTLAAVNARIFEPIREQDFAEETGMDTRNLRDALKSLVERGVVLKIKVGGINFWGLNPHYFISHEKVPGTRGKHTRVEPTQGNVPGVKQGDPTCLTQGTITPGGGALSVRNDSNSFSPKNLIQESRKESLLQPTSSYPEAMLKRWMSFENAGHQGKIEHEKKIFDELLKQHGQEFFSLCSAVISFLEEHGTGKAGTTNKIHSPMDWLRGHWELNLEKYKSWLVRKNTQEAVFLQKVAVDTKSKLDAEEKRLQEMQAREEANRRVDRLGAALERFTATFKTKTAIAEFAERAFSNCDSDFPRVCWNRGGFSHPVARNCILEFFIATEDEVRSTCERELSPKGGN